MTGVGRTRADRGSEERGIGARELRRLSTSLVRRQVVEAPGWDSHSPLLRGAMRFADLQPGLRLRLADVEDRYDMVTRAELPAGVKIALVIDGEARVSYGGQTLALGPSAPSTGALVSLPEATPFVRQGRAGGHERTLILSLAPDWLSRHGYPLATDRRVRVTRWSPSPGLQRLATRLFDARLTVAPDPAHHLQLSGFALAMAGEAFTTLSEQAEKAEHGGCIAGEERRPPDRRLQRLMALVDSGEVHRLSQEDVARHVGMSLSSLQRRFRACYGESLGRFLRRRRLETGLAALRNEGVSVEAAAILAGYSSAANFATAFKREFGARPGDLRRKPTAVSSA
ncbi:MULTISPECIES: AraC family transcriptional regulator [unclassified Modicisalibacter]|uniref:helix-turn-helix domain-containing protein n=1 Tax=unclassified Modicisalibacter TaxID=2679913 RepID=UPI001CCA30ED|nr:MULTISPECIES: AraC family transcriptional regulator [unclassified Modicisalibacter]MBZ9557448.1 helix-turn-helix transcriptional regulator [Modicisalibacter sp. R2A 31.J]MBZ9573886.1 helix-turn-helix transcriptional regulator [Modicisalibacter sp. MOD 31.J]